MVRRESNEHRVLHSDRAGLVLGSSCDIAYELSLVMPASLTAFYGNRDHTCVSTAKTWFDGACARLLRGHNREVECRWEDWMLTSVGRLR